jgi:transmembrane sensor
MTIPPPAHPPAAPFINPDEAALDWFVRRSGGSLDAADEAGFQAWLAADSAHFAAFARHQDDWRALDALPADGLRTWPGASGNSKPCSRRRLPPRAASSSR